MSFVERSYPLQASQNVKFYPIEDARIQNNFFILMFHVVRPPAAMKNSRGADKETTIGEVFGTLLSRLAWLHARSRYTAKRRKTFCERVGSVCFRRDGQRGKKVEPPVSGAPTLGHWATKSGLNSFARDRPPCICIE